MLPQRTHTEGNRRRYLVDYRTWMNRGTTLAEFTAVVSAGAVATVDGVTINSEGYGVFFVNGGEEGEEFTVTLTATTSSNEIKIDAVPFVVVAP